MDIHPDLTPGAMTGLAWYYLLAASLNAAASAYVAYLEMVSEGASREGLLPRTRRFPRWLAAVCLGLFAGAAALIAARGAFGGGFPATTVAYGLAGLANFAVAIAAGSDAAHFAEVQDQGHGVGQEVGAPSLDDHIPAVGLGGPIDRTLWALVWAVVSVTFQAMGAVYVLRGQYGLPDFVRDAIGRVAGPTTLLLAASLALVAMYRLRRVVANGLVAWGLANAALLAFGLGLSNDHFRALATRPDHLPVVGLVALLGVLTWIGLRRAVINDARTAQGLPDLETLAADRAPTRTDPASTELIAMVILTTVLIVWAVSIPAPIGPPPGPDAATGPAETTWYFLGLREMLDDFDPWLAGVVLPGMIVAGLMAMPYLDANPRGDGYFTIEQCKFAYLTFQYGFLVLWVGLVLAGAFLRGPTVPMDDVNLSDVFWVQFLGASRPSNVLRRESPGIALVAAYVLALPPLVGRLLGRGSADRGGWPRRAVTAVLLLFMAGIPIKMVLRGMFHLRYLIAIPEYSFNI